MAVWRSIRAVAGLCAALLAGTGAGLAAGAGGAEAPAWERYRSETGCFAVDLPAAPVVSESGHGTFVGRVESVEYLVEAGRLELRVETHELPLVAELFVTDRGLLDRAGDDLVEGEEAAALESRELEHRGRPAQAMRYRLPIEDGREGRALLVLVGGRLYVLAALHPPGEAASPPVERFFTSFEAWSREQ